MLQKIASHVLIFVILVLTELPEVVVRAEQYLLQSSRVCALSYGANRIKRKISVLRITTFMLVLKR